MKKIFVFLVLIIAIRADAQVTAAQLMAAGMPAEQASIVASVFTGGAVVGNNAFIKSRDAAGSNNINVLKVDSTDDTVLNADSGDLIKFSVATTPVAQLGSTGFTTDLPFASGGFQPIVPAAVVITPSTGVPTPSAGNTLTERHTILAAGAPAAAFVVLPLATASVGKKYTVFNQGSNPLAIVPQTGVINVSAALTPFSCTTLKECECTGLTTSAFGCSQK